MQTPNYQEAKTSDAIKFTDYEGKPFEGYYVGKRKIDTEKFGEATVHQFKAKKDGTLKEFFGFDNFDRKMLSVPINCLTKITYLGKKAHPKDQSKSFHDIEVLYDINMKLNSSEIPKQTVNDDLPF